MATKNLTRAAIFSVAVAFVLAMARAWSSAWPRAALPAAAYKTVPPATQPGERSWLADQLNLSPEQREKVKAIWSDAVQGQGAQGRRRRHAYMKGATRRSWPCSPTSRRPATSRCRPTTTTKVGELNKERDKAVQQAVERTKQVLTDPQRQRHDQLMKEHGPKDHGDHGEHGHWPGRGLPHPGDVKNGTGGPGNPGGPRRLSRRPSVRGCPAARAAPRPTRDRRPGRRRPVVPATRLRHLSDRVSDPNLQEKRRRRLRLRDSFGKPVAKRKRRSGVEEADPSAAVPSTTDDLIPRSGDRRGSRAFRRPAT